jgi:hypothetical protein
MSPEFIYFVKQDGDLISLHNHPRFQALIASGEANLPNAEACGQPAHVEVSRSPKFC